MSSDSVQGMVKYSLICDVRLWAFTHMSLARLAARRQADAQRRGAAVGVRLLAGGLQPGRGAAAGDSVGARHAQRRGGGGVRGRDPTHHAVYWCLKRQYAGATAWQTYVVPCAQTTWQEFRGRRGS